VWAVALPLATFAASPEHASTAGAVFGLAVYAAGSIVCHQLPDRTFRLWSAGMPVCARCTGIYAGAAISAIILAAAKARSAASNNHKRREGHRGNHPPFAMAALSPFGSPRLTRGGASGPVPPDSGERSGIAPVAVRRTLLVAVLPTLATLLFEWSTGTVPANWVRALAGVPIGAAVTWAIGSFADVK
jgi:Predicted membrane protein (DUF2085)